MWTVWHTPRYLREYRGGDHFTGASGDFFRVIHDPAVGERQERWDSVAAVWVDDKGAVDELDMRWFGGDVPYEEEEMRERHPDLMRGEATRGEWIDRYRQLFGVGSHDVPLIAEATVADSRAGGCVARLYDSRLSGALLLELDLPEAQLAPVGPRSEWHTIGGDDRERFLVGLGATERDLARIFEHAFRDVPDGNVAELMRTLEHSWQFAGDDHPDLGPHRNMYRSGRSERFED